TAPPGSRIVPLSNRQSATNWSRPFAPCSKRRQADMASFPQYDAALLTRLAAQTASILSVFAQRSYSRIEPPILQPAGLFLDRSGEEIRRRTFLRTAPGGRELCLRPERTTPVCRMQLAGAATFPARLSYHGPAFRYQPNQ